MKITMLALFLGLCSSLASAADKVPAHPYVEIVTTEGTIVLELDGKQAPLTVGHFLELVDSGFYDGADFSSRHSRFHGPGRRLYARPQTQGDRRHDSERIGQRHEQRPRHDRHGTDRGPAFGKLAIFYQCRRQQPPGSEKKHAPVETGATRSSASSFREWKLSTRSWRCRQDHEASSSRTYRLCQSSSRRCRATRLSNK